MLWTNVCVVLLLRRPTRDPKKPLTVSSPRGYMYVCSPNRVDLPGSPPLAKFLPRRLRIHDSMHQMVNQVSLTTTLCSTFDIGMSIPPALKCAKRAYIGFQLAQIDPLLHPGRFGPRPWAQSGVTSYKMRRISPQSFSGGCTSRRRFRILFRPGCSQWAFIPCSPGSSSPSA